MSSGTLSLPKRLRLQAHFGFHSVPFKKSMAAHEMFDSRSQRELLHGLNIWADLHGIALVTGLSGAGKSITLRRFTQDLDDSRFRVVHLTHVPATLHGFLRSINRALGLPMRAHAADLFDQAHAALTGHGDDEGPHPVLVLDDAEGARPEILDTLRRLTAYALDADDRFSVLITGTDALLRTLKDPTLEPFVTRIGFACALKPFTLEDTRNYVAFHLHRAGAPERLFSDDAVRRLFQASQGTPRRINQIALYALIQAAVQGLDTINGDFVQTLLQIHPLYESGVRT